MRHSLRSEAGNAALEFLTAGVILLVPLVYLALALAAAQGASLAVEGAAREAARVYVSASEDAAPAAASTRGTTATDARATDAARADAAAHASADRAVTVALADRRIARRPGDLSVTCDVGRPDCFARGRAVTARVRAQIELPFVPPIFGLDRLARIPIEASATVPILRVGAAP